MYRRTLSLTGAALALAVPAASAAELGDRPLRPGSRGADVRALQTALTRLRIVTPADGAYGPGTARSVRRYERAHHLTVDGRVSRVQGRGVARRAARAPIAAPDARPAPGATAVLAADGRTARAPAAAPAAVRAAIVAANRIAGRPYVYGGGHRRFRSRGYDCSGAVSYVLHAAGVLASPRASGGLEGWGRRGRGRWISVHANAGHAYVVVAGLRFDTSGRGGSGPRWRPERRSGGGFVVRHAPGL